MVGFEEVTLGKRQLHIYSKHKILTVELKPFNERVGGINEGYVNLEPARRICPLKYYWARSPGPIKSGYRLIVASRDLEEDRVPTFFKKGVFNESISGIFDLERRIVAVTFKFSSCVGEENYRLRLDPIYQDELEN